MNEQRGFARIAYQIGQAGRMLRNHRAHVLLLLFCYTVSFLLPLVVSAYRDNAFQPYAFEGDIILSLSADSREQQTALFDLDQFLALLDRIGLSPGQQANINAGVSGGVSLDGEYIKGGIHYTHPHAGDERLLPLIGPSGYLLGRPVEREGECVVGGAIRRGRKPETLIGQQVLISGKSHTIVGAADRRQVGVLAAMRPDIADRFPRLLFSYAGEDQRGEGNRLADALEDEGYTVWLTRYTRQENESGAAWAEQSADFYAVFSWISCAFCFIATLSVISAVLYDNRRLVYIKLLLGAGRKQIVLEYFFFFAMISLASGALAAALLTPLSRLFSVIGFDKLFFFSFDMLALLFGLGLGTSLLGAVYVAYRLGRRVV